MTQLMFKVLYSMCLTYDLPLMPYLPSYFGFKNGKLIMFVAQDKCDYEEFITRYMIK